MFRQQIEQYNPVLNAIVATDFEAARLSARQADNYLSKHQVLIGPLHGLPTAVKDIFATRNLKTTYGDPDKSKYVPTYDDVVVTRERAAGAVILGKTNTPYYASGGITRNEVYGLTRNPWNLKKTTSGSGGGGVSALASGMVAYADGSDVAGSVRSPGGWTNCVGFRPSSGRIPGYHGTLADGSTSTAGVFTRCVRDAALFLQACDGPHRESLVPYPGALGGTLGFSRFPAAKAGMGFDVIPELNMDPETSVSLKAVWAPVFSAKRLDNEIATMLEDHRKTFEEILRVENVELDFIDAYQSIYLDYNILAQVKSLPASVLQGFENGRSIKPSVKGMIERCKSLDAISVMEVLNQREALWVRVQKLFETHPLIISPIHPTRAFDANDTVAESQYDWAGHYFAPLFGLPSISIPMGFTDDGMPCGLMITGKPGDDLLVLQTAHAFEQKNVFHLQIPDLSEVKGNKLSY